MSILIPLAIAGILLWAVNAYIPMDDKIKKILNVVVIVVVILWLLQAFGLLGSVNSIGIK